jgi:hypothetical protein
VTLPANITVSFDFSSGATFGYPFTVGDAKYGVIGVSQLASTEVPDPVVDLTDQTYQITIDRGRAIQSDTYIAGTAVVRVLDPNSDFNPQNPSSPYYGHLTPMRKLRVASTTSSGTSYLFSGYVTEYRYHYPINQETAYVDIYCADAFRLFQLSQVQLVEHASSDQPTGTRMNKLLDAVAFPSNMRVIDAGNSIVQADAGTLRTSLAALKNIEFSEQGAFYIRGDGTAVFRSRDNVVSSISGTPIEFNQTTGIPYANLVFAFDDKLIINQASITRIGGTSQFYENTASAIKYFPHQYSVQDLQIATDADAANIAATYVATRQATSIRIDQMLVNLLDPAVPTNTMIGLDYFSNVKITNVQPDGSTIIKQLQCQGLKWEITPQKFQCTVTTLEPITDGFVLGSPVNGIIGVSAMTY